MKQSLKRDASVLFLTLFAGSLLVYPVLAANTAVNLAVPYHGQETDWYCGPASAQMWIDYHGDSTSQDTLYQYIRSQNLEGSLWYTDPKGLANCVQHYVNNLVVDDHSWTNPDSAVLGQAVDIVNRGIPSASLTENGAHWMLVKGVNYFEYGGQVYSVNGVWVHDPDSWLDNPINEYLTVDDWMNHFTSVSLTGLEQSRWYDRYVTVQGYWGRSVPDYTAETENWHLMDNSEDDIILSKDIDIPRFAWDQMNKWNVFQKEIEGCNAGDLIYVHSLVDRYNDYYLIPFEKNGEIIVVASVTIGGEVADFSGCIELPSGLFQILPTHEETLKALHEKGYQSAGNVQAVWKPCLQSMSMFHPLWECETTTGEIRYVGYDQKNKIQVYDELTEKKLAG